MLTDFLFTIQWWSIFLIIGIIFFPLTSFLFYKFYDRGYIFSKVIGVVIISYVLYLLGLLHILPNATLSIYAVTFLIIITTGVFLYIRPNWRKKLLINKKQFFLILFEEMIFLFALIFWAYIRGHQPNIHGLEKFMDYGFINSISRGEYFPPKDMWFPPFSINYYFFGHLFTSILTKASLIPSFITYNLMVATIFAFAVTLPFSIGFNIYNFFSQSDNQKNNFKYAVICGILAGFLVSSSGNLHTLYMLFEPYVNEHPQPVWELQFNPESVPNSYWYPNATRYIYNTIHEFPLYSFVVSDLHGHVLSIPIILTIIGLLLNTLITGFQKKTYLYAIFVSFFIACAYMTNAWDGIIYGMLGTVTLTAIVIRYYYQEKSSFIHSLFHSIQKKEVIFESVLLTFIVLAGFILFSLPFSLFFKPFVSGIGVLCAPEFLTNIGKIGPLLFEADHCQKSPFWQLIILYGYFYFGVITFLFLIFQKTNKKLFLFLFKRSFIQIHTSDLFILLLIFMATLLLIIPEFIYMKDIYPAHYRANTMFKLAYQAYIMLSLVCAYSFTRMLSNTKTILIKSKWYKKGLFIVWVFVFLFLTFFVSIYPYFAVKSYYEDLHTYKGLNGIEYLNTVYPSDYKVIQWLEKNVTGQPVLLEAQGDSYTDHARISSYTGLPTVLGWTVHEWLWRGSYDIPSPRIEEVRIVYESNDLAETKMLLKKYNVQYVYIGDLERQKYLNINSQKFNELGTIVFTDNNSLLYKINSQL